jgi:hypothetical protein
MRAPAEADRRARARARWRRWYHDDKAGIATARVKYNGVSLAKLIMSGWLPAHKATYSDAEIAAAIADLIATGDLPPRKP